jgi:hypothetical protein
MEPEHYSFNGVLKNKKDLELYLQAGRKGFGKIFGQIEPLNLTIKLHTWPAENLPLPGGVYADLQGQVSIDGTVSRDEAKIDLAADSLKIGGSRPESLTARLLMKSGYWFYQAQSTTKRWHIAGRMLEKDKWDAAIDLRDLPLEEYLPWLHCRMPAGGRISGSARYSSDKTGDANLVIKNIVWNKKQVGNGKLTVQLTPEVLDVKECSIHSGKGTVTGHARIGMEKGKQDCSMAVTCYRFPIMNKLVQGPLTVTGKITDEAGKMGFEGTVGSGGFRIGEWATRRLKARVKATGDRLEIDDLAWDPLAEGSVTVDFKTRRIDGKTAFRNIPVENITSALAGHATGKATVSGTIEAPRLHLEYVMPDTRYKDVVFSQAGVADYGDKKICVEKIHISTGTGTIDLSGDLWPDVKLAGKMENCPIQFLGMVAGARLPCSGVVNGQAVIEGKPSEPGISLEFAGKGIEVGGMQLAECGGKLKYAAGTIGIDYIKSKYKDSELHVLAGSRVDLANRQIGLATEWRNVHLGPVDCFGNVGITGQWDGVGQKCAVSGVIKADKFWMNQYDAEEIAIGFDYRDGVISLHPQQKSMCAVSGAVDLRRLPQVIFNRFAVVGRDKGEVMLDGEIGAANWKFSLSGKNAAAETISEMLEMPISVTGPIGLTIVGRGSLDEPLLEGSISIANGTFSGVPYDSLTVQFSARQDVLTLTRAHLLKKDQYSINATGFCPFFLTEAGRKRVQNDRIDMTIAIEEGTLNLLSALSSDIKNASDSLRAQARITGTMAKPVANGYLRIVDGEINARRYFSKITRLSADLVWKDNLLTVREMTGRVGEGKVGVSGTVLLDGLKPKEYGLQFASLGRRGIPISVPELPIPSPLFKSEDWEFFSNLSHGEPRFAISFTGTSEKPVLAGWVELENTHFTYPSLAKGGGGESILDTLWSKLSLDLAIRSGKNTWYDNELASVNIVGGIVLKGKWLGPSVTGRVDSVRGTISYVGTEFTVKRAALEIVKDTAYLEAEAETEIYGKTPGESDIIQLVIDKASLERIQPRFLSKNNPNMTPEKALAKATGIDPETYSKTDQEYILRQQMIRLIDSTLATPLARNLLRRSGIVDSFRVQYLSQEPIQPVNPENPTLTELLYGTKYSLEKYVTDRMLFGYSVTFDQVQNRLDLRHELELSYRLKKNIRLKGVYELETSNPLRQHDRRITVEQQWRFGWPQKKK